MSNPQYPMQQYQSHKVVNACPMTIGEYIKLRGGILPETETPDDSGFLVEHLDTPASVHPDFVNYISWVPEAEFNQDYTHKPSHTQGGFLMRYLFDMSEEVRKAGDAFNALQNELQGKEQTALDKAALGEKAMVYFALRNHYGAMVNSLGHLAQLDGTIDISKVPMFELEKVPYGIIQSLVSQLSYRFYRVEDSNITACHALLPNNFKVGYGESGCLNAADFDQALGEKYARERAEADAINNLWFAEGYVRAMRFI